MGATTITTQKHKNGRYHRKICWCLEFDNILNDLHSRVNRIIYTDHIYEKHGTASDRNYRFDKITLNEVIKGEVIEVWIVDGLIDRFLVRFKYSLSDDMLGVFSVNGHDLVCVTLWLNEKNNNHSNLDYSLYQTELSRDNMNNNRGSKLSDMLDPKVYDELLRRYAK